MDRRVVDLLKDYARAQPLRPRHPELGRATIKIGFAVRAARSSRRYDSKYTDRPFDTPGLGRTNFIQLCAAPSYHGSWIECFFRVSILMAGFFFVKKLLYGLSPPGLCELNRLDFFSCRNPADYVGRDRRIRRPNF